MAKPKTTKDYETLGRVVSAIYDTGFLDKHQSYKNSFIKGVFSGLGGVLGATVVLAFVVWFLSLFGHVPLLGNFVDVINNTIRSAKK